MAKITIVIEDKPDNKVKVVSDPSLETIFSMANSGHELTSAHGYAFQALNVIREHSRKKEPSRILIPKKRF